MAEIGSSVTEEAVVGVVVVVVECAQRARAGELGQVCPRSAVLIAGAGLLRYTPLPFCAGK